MSLAQERAVLLRGSTPSDLVVETASGESIPIDAEELATPSAPAAAAPPPNGALEVAAMQRALLDSESAAVFLMCHGRDVPSEFAQTSFQLPVPGLAACYSRRL